MKKFLFLIFFMTASVFVFSQNTGISSVFDSISEGVFTNELDAAVSVDGMLSSGPDFRSLQHDYLFAGLTNFELKMLAQSASFSSLSPLWAGFYKAGEKPWSLFGALGASGTPGNASDGTTYTQGASVPVTSGTSTTTYQWNSLSQTMDYTANRIFNTLSLSGQYLFALGGVNSGVYVNVDLTNADPQGSNFKQTDVYYYNSTGAGVVPTPLVDYNYSETMTNRNNTSDFTVAVPLFIPDGDSSQLFNFRTFFEVIDKSVTDTESYSGTPQAVQTWNSTTVAADITARELTGELAVDYTWKTKGLWGKNPKDQFWVKGSGDFSLTGGTYGTSSIAQDLSAAGGGAAIVNGTRLDNQGTYTGVPGFGATVSADAGHSFYFDLGSGVEFGLTPETSLQYALTLPATITTQTTVAKTDGNADGKFDNAADTITTTTVTYTNTAFNTLTGALSNASTINSITCNMSLPVAVTFTPKGWPITFILGSKPSVSATMTFTGTKTSTTETVVSAVDGTGAASGGTTTFKAVTPNEASNMTTTYVVGATHNIGFSMSISDAVRIDVNLDAFSVMGPVNNIFDFGDLTAQAIIALP